MDKRRTGLTIKRVPTTFDPRVRVDSLAAGSVFSINDSDLWMLMEVSPAVKYVNHMTMRDESVLLCVGLHSGQLCHISQSQSVYPQADAVLLVPSTN